MHKFRELNVYKKAIKLTSSVRKLTKRFPKDEMFVLSSQFRRACNSIALNLAEGAGNDSQKEFSKFIGYSIRSAYECICCLDIACENEYITLKELDTHFKQIDEIIAVLVGLQKSQKKQNIIML